MSKYLIGCDPEVFVKQAGVFKSAHALIPGDKGHPFRVKKGAVQVDGMALEFNIDPAATEDEFLFNVQEVYQQLCAMVPDYEVVAVPVAHFTQEYMSVQPRESLELGCDPDYNAWERAVNIKPNGERPMRTASGHIHIGWLSPDNYSNDTFGDACEVGKQMDVVLGIPSLFYDDDIERREMCGEAGCIRPKPYGVEYRTLSNKWLSSPALTRWVFRTAQKGMELMDSGRLLYNELTQKGFDVQDIINTSNKKEARKIVKLLNLEVCHG